MDQLILAKGDEAKAVDLPEGTFDGKPEQIKATLIQALNSLIWAQALNVKNHKPGTANG